MKKIESRRLLALVTNVAHISDDLVEALEAFRDIDQRPEEAADVQTLRSAIEEARFLFFEHHRALRTIRNKRNASAKPTREEFQADVLNHFPGTTVLPEHRGLTIGTETLAPEVADQVRAYAKRQGLTPTKGGSTWVRIFGFPRKGKN